MNIKKISVAKDFSDMPLGRDEHDGPFNGKRFREEILVPALTDYETVQVDLSGTLGYGSSFLDEAFGGLIREHNFELSDLRTRLIITHVRELTVNRVWNYIEEAASGTRSK